MKKTEKENKEQIEGEIVSEFSDDDFFDDCPICQALKLAKEEGRKMTIEETKEEHVAEPEQNKPKKTPAKKNTPNNKKEAEP